MSCRRASYRCTSFLKQLKNITRERHFLAIFGTFGRFSETIQVTLMVPETRVARFFLVQYTKKGENVPNDHNIYQMTTIYTK
jgi:hypothetical protein